MKIIYLREEEISTEIPSSEISDINTEIIDKTAEPDFQNDTRDIEPNFNNKVLEPERKALPPSDRSYYDYRIVPYYIPVGTKNYYSYRDSYLDYDRVIARDIIDKNYRFSDGSYGILYRYEDIEIRAGSKKNLIEVSIDGEIFTKKVKNSEKARKIVAKLSNVLYNEGENRLLMLLIKYKFN